MASSGLEADAPRSNSTSLAMSRAAAEVAANFVRGGKTAKAARDFESILLTSLFDGLERSFSFDSKDDERLPGASDYRLMGTRALAEAVSAAGGIGIAKLVMDHLPLGKNHAK